MVPDHLIDEIQRLHGAGQRAYHNWSHPRAMLALFEQVKPLVNDVIAVQCAILAHDVIYEPGRGDNESQSAEWAKRHFAEIIVEPSLSRAMMMILATARHEMPPGLSPDDINDTGLFLDLDLSILGADSETFDTYETTIREEYRSVPIALFSARRAEILEGFLARPTLYFSAWGRERFAARARENLMRSLIRLRSAPAG
jgi:predicted metal-dependent HD superfamily phosphohydrolase